MAASCSSVFTRQEDGRSSLRSSLGTLTSSGRSILMTTDHHRVHTCSYRHRGGVTLKGIIAGGGQYSEHGVCLLQQLVKVTPGFQLRNSLRVPSLLSKEGLLHVAPCSHTAGTSPLPLLLWLLSRSPDVFPRHLAPPSAPTDP